jgi:hypothetical protein
MDHREVLIILSTTAAAWPLPARAQSTEAAHSLRRAACGLTLSMGFILGSSLVASTDDGNPAMREPTPELSDDAPTDAINLPTRSEAC